MVCRFPVARTAYSVVAATLLASCSPSGQSPSTPGEIPAEVRAKTIVISHNDAPMRLQGAKRSKAAARSLAEDALQAARAPNSKFDDVVTRFSDHAETKKRGGRFNRVLKRSDLAGPFEAVGEALFSLKVGEVSEIVESPYGFQIVTRLDVDDYVPTQVGASHILIKYKGAERSDATRTKEEAKKLAAEILQETQAPGADFAALARKHSEGPSGPKGGDLGVFTREKMVPPFSSAAFALKVGEITGPVETRFGFHIIKRTK